MTNQACVTLFERHRLAIRLLALTFVFVLATFLLNARAEAACTVPNQITNGQPADATAVMGNFNALKDCAVSASGAPAVGNLPVFSDSKTITSGNLSGDCATGGTLTVTCTKTSGMPFGPFATGADAGQLTGTVSVNRFANGINADNSRFLRGDGTWATPPGGGGSGGASLITFNPGEVNASSHATKGNRFKLGRSTPVNELVMIVSPDTTTQKFEIRLFQLASDGVTVASQVATSGQLSVTATGNQLVSYKPTDAIVLLASTWYALVLVRTDGTGSSSCRITQTTKANSGAFFLESSNVYIANNNPTVGTVFVTGTLSIGSYMVQ